MCRATDLQPTFYQWDLAWINTFVDAGAEATLEAAAPVDELHVGTHVGLAAVAADGAGLSVVDHEQWSLGGRKHSRANRAVRKFLGRSPSLKVFWNHDGGTNS